MPAVMTPAVTDEGHLRDVLWVRRGRFRIASNSLRNPHSLPRKSAPVSSDAAVAASHFFHKARNPDAAQFRVQVPAFLRAFLLGSMRKVRLETCTLLFVRRVLSMMYSTACLRTRWNFTMFCVLRRIHYRSIREKDGA